MIPENCSAPQTSPHCGSRMGTECQGHVSDASVVSRRMPHCHLSRDTVLLHCRASWRPAAAWSLRIAVKPQHTDEETNRAKEKGAARAGGQFQVVTRTKLLLSAAATTLEPLVGGPSLPLKPYGHRLVDISAWAPEVEAHPECEVPRTPSGVAREEQFSGVLLLLLPQGSPSSQ